jgi:hypothetical protein
MAGGGNGMTATSASNVRPAIGRNIERIVPDPCRTDIRVSRLDAKAYGVFAVFFGMSKVDMVLEAYPTDVPSGRCAATSPPVPAPRLIPGPGLAQQIVSEPRS